MFYSAEAIGIMSNSKKNSLLWIYILVLSILVGGCVRVAFISLFHIVIAGVFLLTIVEQGFEINYYRDNPIMLFLGCWLLVAFISNVWSVSKGLSLRYTYNIYMIYAVGYIFTTRIEKEMIPQIIRFMVILLFLLNVAALWEALTGNHLNSEYLSNVNRVRIFKYLPATFFYNPNDFATYIIQIIPFTLVGLISGNSLVKTTAAINLPFSLFSIFAAQARTQMLVLVFTYIVFVLFILRKAQLFKVLLGVVIGVIILATVYPDVAMIFREGLDSISGGEIRSSADEGSLATRIALLKNGFFILRDSFGFGVGAGCHRLVMKEYASKYYETHNVLVMHNFVGELFADYGLFIGILFIVIMVKAYKILMKISKNMQDEEMKVFFAALAITLLTFVFSAISSSSLIQLTSLWTTFCLIGGVIKLYS